MCVLCFVYVALVEWWSSQKWITTRRDNYALRKQQRQSGKGDGGGGREGGGIIHSDNAEIYWAESFVPFKFCVPLIDIINDNLSLWMQQQTSSSHCRSLGQFTYFNSFRIINDLLIYVICTYTYKLPLPCFWVFCNYSHFGDSLSV